MNVCDLYKSISYNMNWIVDRRSTPYEYSNQFLPGNIQTNCIKLRAIFTETTVSDNGLSLKNCPNPE